MEKDFGCNKEHIFIDIVSGSKVERPGLTQCLETLSTGDTLVVWRLDRLGRSIFHLIMLIEELGNLRLASNRFVMELLIIKI